MALEELEAAGDRMRARGLAPEGARDLWAQLPVPAELLVPGRGRAQRSSSGWTCVYPCISTVQSPRERRSATARNSAWQSADGARRPR